MALYEESLARLNDAQRLAVTTTEGPVLVIAGPGTGKTQLLTTRIAHILATTDTLPQNILCLTFTESGALTMRERLTGMIGKSAYDVTISTYHAFGSDIIRRFPDYFSDDPNMQPVDELGIDSIFREIITQLSFNNPLKYADTYVRDIRSLISDAKRALLTPDNLEAVASQNLDYITTASPVVAETLGEIVRLSKKNVPAFERLLDQLEAMTPPADSQKTSSAGSLIPLSTILLRELAEALDEVRILDKQTPLTRWKNKWLARDTAGAFVIDGKKTNEKLLAVADVYRKYIAELAARSLFDYDDMILRAVHALESHADLRYTLQEQYLYVLLDEFQDTNGAQLRLVELLTNNPVHEGRPNVLGVGDDDQAIYAFQGADYSHMLHFNQMYRDVLPVTLTQNYRSHADVLHIAEGIATQIQERLHHHFPAIKKTLTAEAKLPPATIERREAKSDIGQFAWVARRIKQLINGGTPPGEIAVLAPQHKYLAPLVPYLAQEQIPVRYDKRENILDDPVITQLLRMAELCIALQRGDRTSSNALWAEVLSFNFWQLPTSLIWKLSWQAQDEDRSWTEVLYDDEQLKPIALFFIRLSQLVETETLEIMLDYLVGVQPLPLGEAGHEAFTSPFYGHNFGLLESALSETATQSSNTAFWDLLSNLIVLRSRLREYRRGSEELLRLRDFLSFVEAHRAAELQILNTSPYASDSNAVQLMTAFKSKGMEFDAVFMLAVSDEAWGSKARGAGNRISLPQNLQFIRYAGATDDERLRLFYVALTRAKTQLYLASYTRTFAGSQLNHLKYLGEGQDSAGAWHSPLLPTRKQAILPVDQESTEPLSSDLTAYWQQRHELALSNADLHSLLHDRLERFQISPTHVNDFTDVQCCGPRAFFLRTILRFPTAPKPEVQFGNAMHETLEWICKIVAQDNLMPSRQALQKTFEKRLHDKKLRPDITAQYLERGLEALTAYIQQRAEVLAQESIAEYNFRNEGVFIGEAHLTGKIDKLIIDRKQKTITIVDYKTGKKSYSSWKHDTKLHKYRLQLYFYKILVEGSHTYAGFKVTDAYLEFVEPDEDGAINQLHLVFDEAEYARAKALIEAIWKRITSIDLPSVEGYDATVSGIEDFEAFLLEK